MEEDSNYQPAIQHVASLCLNAFLFSFFSIPSGRETRIISSSVSWIRKYFETIVEDKHDEIFTTKPKVRQHPPPFGKWKLCLVFH